MTRRSSTIALLMFTACAGSGGGCNGKGDDSAGDTCNIQLHSSFPDEGGTDMCFRSDVEFTFEGNVEDAQITLADSNGANVPGTTSSNAAGSDIVVSFHPDAPLAPNTAYIATLTHCTTPSGEDTETLSFTTDAYGEPLAVDPSKLVGNVYAVDLKNDSRFHEPPGVANVLQPMLDRIIWLEVLDASATGITLRLAVAADESDSVQDMCIPTVDFDNGTLDGPTFEVGPNDIEIPIGDVLVELKAVVASGTFSADGLTFGCGGFTGLLDTRPVVPLMGGDHDAFVCETVGAYGAQCIACDDGEPLCLELVVDQAVTKPPAKGVKIVPVTDADVENNPTCP
jgi:hypothetical protein